MKSFAVALLALLALANGQSICDTYSGGTNLELVSTVVLAVFGQVTTPGGPLAEYFNGTVPAGSTDYTDEQNNGDQIAALANGLITFFGGALGCTDGTIAAYNGSSMAVVHAPIPIDNKAFTIFNGAVLGVMQAAGVSVTDLQTVNGVLESTRPDICNQADCSTICNRYTGLLGITGVELVGGLVGQVFAAVTTPTNPLYGFFNGSIPAGSTDYTTDEAAAGVLANGLITFFGEALGCTDGSIAPYTGGAMAPVHAAIPIDNFAFVTFNSAITSLATEGGVAPADVQAIADLLESLRGDICNQADCVVTSSTATPTNTDTSATSATATTATSATATNQEDSAAGVVVPMTALFATLALAF